MGIGEKRHRLTLQRRSSTADSYGEDVRTYADLAVVWGSLEAVRAGERFLGLQVDAEVTHRIEIRRSAEYAVIGAQDQIKLGTRTFEIMSAVDPKGRGRDIEIMVKERV